MIQAFYLKKSQIYSKQLEINEEIPKGLVWLDIISPTKDEELSLEAALKIEIPSKEEQWKNYILNRLYKDNKIYYTSLSVISKAHTQFPVTSTITFIITPQYFITVRYVAPTSFKNFSEYMEKFPEKYVDVFDVFEGLISEIVTRVAYNLELVVNDLDTISHGIYSKERFSNSPRNTSLYLQEILLKIGSCNDLNIKINESLHSLLSVLGFVKDMHEEHIGKTSIKTIINDVNSLTQQTTFLSDKITFLLDATLGMINVEQNLIIKLFTIVAVFLMPPTLISSIYGMNFQDMPELTWHYGYPMAVTLMIICILIPLIFFRRKGWL